MNEELERLLALTRDHVMTPEEIFEQRVSWILGMQDSESTVTEQQVRTQLMRMEGRTVEQRNQSAVCEAATALVRKMDQIHADPRFQGIWGYLAVHGQGYTGPKYEVEFGALKAALEGTASQPALSASPEGTMPGPDRHDAPTRDA